MKKFYFLTLLSFAFTFVTAQTVFINEIHYDNAGGDVDEFVEIAGPAGTDLTGWSIVLYNGSNGASYQTIDLTGSIIDDEGEGYGALSFYPSSIQNGAPDGVALIDNNGTVVQFLSYEGSFAATNGPAVGVTSVDIGVAETSSTPAGESLQLSGTVMDLEADYTDFTWTGPTTASDGTLNAGQTFPTLSNKNFETEEFSVYPNPVTNGFVNIKTTSNNAINVTVIDVLGKQVVKQTLTTNRLNVTKLKTGMYLLNIEQNGASTTKKLIVE